MILPGVSGGYLLLVLGAYVPILSGIDAFRAALSARDVPELLAVGTGVVLPVGLGVIVGIAVVGLYGVVSLAVALIIIPLGVYVTLPRNGEGTARRTTRGR